MTRQPGAARRGITLTEVLISILIMGVGVISLATLFPLGMVRLRAAAQQSRSAYLAQSATADLSAMNLLHKPTFFQSWYGTNAPFGVVTNSDYSATAPALGPQVLALDPFSMDPLPNGKAGMLSTGLYASGPGQSGPGLPICYDPLWWAVAAGNGVTATVKGTGEFRFGQGVFYTPLSSTVANQFLRTDPGGGVASAHGLQRLTNFVTTAQLNSLGLSSSYWKLLDPTTVFVSPDDPVMQNSDQPAQIIGTANSNLSGVVPQMSGGLPVNDWRYTWLFTGYEVDVTNATAFVGDVVVMEGRPLAIDSVATPQSGGATSQTASGEIVVEAVFGYSGTVSPAGKGYGVAADRTVLLRWPATMPDPEIKVGSWIADVTYERNTATSNTRVSNAAATGTIYPFQRCYWYQVTKRTDVQTDTDATLTVPYRRIVVTVNTPLKARTLLNAGGTVVNLNTALFMPSVVNVFSRTIFVRTDY